MLGLNLGLSLYRQARTWLVSHLFEAGEQGVWYDPSDLTTLFRDSAGTVPVTAVEQPVGKILDKSGRGNHATQATSTKRPVLSAKVNLLTGSAALATQSVTTAAIPYTLKHTGTGTITLSGTSTAGPLVGPGTLTFTPTAGTLTLTVTGSVTEAQLETGAVATRYQWVNTAVDYDTVGFPKYLKFDGVDDSMSTASIDFTAGDKMTVFAGLLTTLTTGSGIVMELGATYTLAGCLNIHSNYSAGYISASITQSVTSIYGFNRAPIQTLVLTLKADCAGVSATDEIIMRRDGINKVLGQQGGYVGPAGTGNFGNYPLFIGSRNNSGNFFSGNIYSLIIRGALRSDAQIINAETYVNSKTGAY
jgi:hypothetical protein